jgi:hypothetical protein
MRCEYEIDDGGVLTVCGAYMQEYTDVWNGMRYISICPVCVENSNIQSCKRHPKEFFLKSAFCRVCEIFNAFGEEGVGY